MTLENKNKTNSYLEVNFNEHKIMDESFSGFQPGQGLHGVADVSLRDFLNILRADDVDDSSLTGRVMYKLHQRVHESGLWLDQSETT